MIQQSTTSYAEKKRLEIEKKQKSELKKLEKEQKLAVIFDKYGAGCIEPFIIYTHGIYGAVGGLGFKNATPEECLKIMETFKPVESWVYKKTHTGFKPADHLENDLTYKHATDGYQLRVDKIERYPTQVSIEYYCDLDNIRFTVKIELQNIHGITPELRGNVSTYNNGDVCEITNVQCVLPIAPRNTTIGGNLIVKGLREIKYSRVDRKSWNNFLLYGPVKETVKLMADECFKRGQLSRQAYLDDKEKGLDPVPMENELPYDQQRGRPGTKKQYDCLRTIEARTDQALAKKHWHEYQKENHLDTNQGYFDHYAWSKHWLEKNDLLIDKSANNYKYGTAWL